MTKDQANEIMELMQREEDALPELLDYVQKLPSGVLLLNHPLVQEIAFDPKKSALQNKRLLYKQEALAKAVSTKNWHSYVFLHERPYRAHALLDVRRFEPDVVHHELIESVWSDSENIWQSQKDWEAIFRKLPDPQKMMDDDERAAFEKLPDKIDVYRGLRHPRYNKLGLSWTTDRKKAEWFATRYRGVVPFNPCVVIGYTRKQHVIAHLLGRNEAEIIVFAKHVKQRRLAFIDQ